jgi:hypothetical protein
MKSLLFFLTAGTLTVFSFVSAATQGPAPANKLPVEKRKESWTTLSLEGSELLGMPPLLGVKDNEATFTRELVRLQWRVNDPIDTYVVIPKLVAKPPVVIYLYNYTTNTDRFMRNNVCAYLSSGGVAMVGFSTAVSGYRFHDRGLNRWFVSELQEGLAASTHDVQKVIDYLATRKDIDISRIGIYGQGSGAAVAILAASVDPRIKVLDLEDTWGDWPDFLAHSAQIPDAERPAYLKPEFLKSVAGLDPVDYLPKLKISLRNQYSLPKSAVPPQARKCIEAALPAQAAHTPLDGTFDWIKQQLNQMGKE